MHGFNDMSAIGLDGSINNVRSGTEISGILDQNAARMEDDVPDDDDLIGMFDEGGTSHGRYSHLCTTLYISVVILYRKYTGAHENDFTPLG